MVGRHAAVAAALVVTLFAGCLQAPLPESGFADVADRADVRYIVDWQLPPNAEPMMLLGGGVAVGDVSGDDWPDVYVVDRNENALFINNRDGTFREAALDWGVTDVGVGRAPALFDCDNDGRLDLFVGNVQSTSRMFRNVGGGFRDVTLAAGLAIWDYVHSVAVADYDVDGDLDLFVGVYGNYSRGGPDFWTAAENGERNWLFENRGDCTFEEVSGDVGLTHSRWTLASSWGDFDADGDPDLYVANDFGLDNLYVNEGGRFVDRAGELGIRANRNGMGAEWFDLEGDGDLDLYVTNIHVPGSEVPAFHGNYLYVNEGGRFVEAARERGAEAAGWAWHAQSFDVENDGDLDLYVANGFVSRGEWDMFYDGEWRLDEGRPEGPGRFTYGDVRFQYNASHVLYLDPGSIPKGMDFRRPRTVDSVSQGGTQPNRLFVNDGAGRFTEGAGEVGLALPGDSRAVAVLDFNRDGALDLVVSQSHHNLRLMRNMGPVGNYLQVALDPGPGRPAYGFGATVTAVVGNATQLRTVDGPSGFQSQGEPVAHFGLGNATGVDALVVAWPWGEETRIEGLAANQRVRVGPDGLLEGSDS